STSPPPAGYLDLPRAGPHLPAGRLSAFAAVSLSPGSPWAACAGPSLGRCPYPPASGKEPSTETRHLEFARLAAVVVVNVPDPPGRRGWRLCASGSRTVGLLRVGWRICAHAIDALLLVHALLLLPAD